jgi:hypothetical protein
MAFENLPGVISEKQDGGLAILETSDRDKVLVLGTAGRGVAETLTAVGRAQEAAVEFGSEGTLIRGMYEAKAQKGKAIILFRIGATAASVEGIGVTASIGGIRIETARKDDSAGEDYQYYYDNTAHRLVVQDAASLEVVYDRDFDNPSTDIDLGQVFVTGTFTASEGADIGTASALVLLKDSPAGTTFIAGTDGTNLSRMEMFEALYNAYQLLENEDLDIILPMDVYQDDLNVSDMAASEILSRDLASLSAYPTAGLEQDALGRVFVQEYEGKFYFWWDTDADGVAEIVPSVGAATASLDAFGNAIDNFYEANYAYQLAFFCHSISENNVEVTGVIGMLPPTSFALSDVSQWVGSLPTYTKQSDGSEIIASASDNGSGLLGNKYMAGQYGFRGGKKDGGLILTSSGYPITSGDAAGVHLELADRGGHLIDIGKHISVVAAYPTMFNAFDTSGLGLTANFAASYAGMYSDLSEKSAPTNKLVVDVRLPFKLGSAKLNDLTGLRYVTLAVKSKGIVVTDAPTAARPDSDYRRLTTMRIAKREVDLFRLKADSFIGEGGAGSTLRAGLQTAAEGAYRDEQKLGFIQRFDLAITATPAQEVAGDATAELNIVPAFELRQITLIMSLLPS